MGVFSTYLFVYIFFQLISVQQEEFPPLPDQMTNALMPTAPGGGDDGGDDDDDDDEEEEEEGIEESDDGSDNETEMVVLDPDHVSLIPFTLPFYAYFF